MDLNYIFPFAKQFFDISLAILTPAKWFLPSLSCFYFSILCWFKGLLTSVPLAHHSMRTIQDALKLFTQPVGHL